MAKYNSLPSKLMHALNYHVVRCEIPYDSDFKMIMSELERLDLTISTVKHEIVKNRIIRKEALEQATRFKNSLNYSYQPKGKDS